MDKIITAQTLERAKILDISKRTIAVIGYGNQGRSQALNLRDSGLKVIIGNLKDNYSQKAEEDGFEVFDIGTAVSKSQIIFVLIPDEIQKYVFKSDITPHLKKGDAVVFASGYNYFYGLVEIPKEVTVLMIAPRMIGYGVREAYLKGEGFPVLISVGNDPKKEGEKLIISLSLALGVFNKNGCAIRSSFKEETLIDLLSEHTWAGAILFLFRAYYDVAVSLGASPEAVIMELYGSGELAEIARGMRDMGLFEQLKTHSNTSQYGQLSIGPKFISDDLKNKMYTEAFRILDGTFAKEWMEEEETGQIVLSRLREIAKDHPMEKEEKKLYRILGRL